MTDQELFDRVATHLLTQGERSINAVGTCAYRGQGGRKCALGVLIPDELYSLALEESFADDSLFRRAAGLSAEQEDLAYTLQDVHDCREPKDWAQALREVATSFHLSPEVLG